MNKIKFFPRPNKLDIGYVYQIEWLDHHDLDNLTIEQAVKHDPCIIKTIGRVLGINRYYILIATEYNENDQLDNEYTRIIKKCIINAKRLE